MFVHLMNTFKTLVKGRGFYPILMVITTWTYSLILFLVFIWELVLYIFKVKYDNPEFKEIVKKNSDKNKKQN
ncbi:hypothetical protein BJV85_003863 [Clostridium acetobutylicum]|uniref:Uncharacterized protein n=1 Tax=Clostridium acetobutylicum (strain ATCC 824 / DSM 792 / JCM 1419 / IAM 19013 / LMG 5710 / NBRC 13948 / NRRL B-527 / VKM B-1787 / 2291 / W) TaxID=272562 RepID=Q97TS6_CLOAB|nr:MULTISPECIES: hypothetical protein [Clostridium]AAK76767.1 Hypothetical protein CA_P0021 [Clostridium acetobutylicum ATCC 824]ADZ22803.1 Conserved hypothetical protein [Clostridium acetobutylicum EA 2018]AEI34763.1 hypothetical protein SMB_P020 [Clostridium acetobutylicum DSM 1731]AWV82312.1 hypothetical protein DK921_19660 [Clostridium acetobutylicum]MBC2396024.1 hypothetical protein [Clostridium acetobutylicum]